MQASGPATPGARVGFIGLGVMGFPMAGHLAAAGHSVSVYNRTLAKAEAWTGKHGGRVAASPFEVAEGADIVISCLRGDGDVREVTAGSDGAFAAMREGSIFIDHTTGSADAAKDLSEQAAVRGIGFLDAPLSGGQFGAEKGTLTILVGGDAAAYRQVQPLMQAYAKATFMMGSAGSGQVTKMVNQILIGGIFESLAEGLNFGMRAGLDMKNAVEVLKQCTGHSWQMDHRAQNMIDGKFDYGFAVRLINKDLGLCLDQAKTLGVPLPITDQINRRFETLMEQGMADLDATSLIKLL